MRLITLPRVMDDGPLSINPDDIRMVAANADEGGIIEGTCAVYLKEGLAIAVNYPPERVLEILEACGVEVVNYMPVEGGVQ